MPTTPIDLDACREILAEAEVLAVQIPSLPKRSQMLIQIAALLFQIGNVEGYFRLVALFEDMVDAMDDDRQKDFVLEPAVLTQAQAGDGAGARRTFGRMHGSRDRARIYLSVGAAKSGRFEAAFQAFQEMPLGYEQRIMLRTIAKEQADRGDLAESLVTLDRALALDREDASARPPSHLLMDKAIVQARLGDLTGAIQTATPIVAGEQHDSALCKVAVLCAKQSDLIHARQAIAKIWSPFEANYACWEIAQTHSDLGEDWTNMLQQMLNDIVDGPNISDESTANKAHMLKRMAQTQALTGDPEGSHVTLIQALRFAENIQDEEMKARALSVIAQAHVEAADDEGYRETIARAFQVVQAMPDESDRMISLRGIAVDQALAGKIADSRDTMALLKNADSSPDWEEIAYAQWEIGNPDAMIRAAQHILDPSRQRIYLFRAAEAQAKVDDVDGCRETLALVRDTIQYLLDPADKLQALLQIAKIQAGLPRF